MEQIIITLGIFQVVLLTYQKIKTSFDTSDNDEKFPTGPTTFIPGPTLFKHVATAEKALVKILQKSLSKSLNILELNL